MATWRLPNGAPRLADQPSRARPGHKMSRSNTVAPRNPHARAMALRRRPRREKRLCTLCRKRAATPGTTKMRRARGESPTTKDALLGPRARLEAKGEAERREARRKARRARRARREARQGEPAEQRPKDLRAGPRRTSAARKCSEAAARCLESPCGGFSLDTLNAHTVVETSTPCADVVRCLGFLDEN